MSREVHDDRLVAWPAPVQAAQSGWSELADRVGGTDAGASWAVRYRRRLLASDTLLILLAVVVAAVVEAFRDKASLADLFLRPSQADLLQNYGYPLGIGLLWALCLSLHRTRDLSVVGTGVAEYKRVVNATLMTFTFIALVISITGHEGMRAYFFVALPGGAVGLIATRYGQRRWLLRKRRQGFFLSRAIVVGSRADVRYVIDRIDEKPGALYDVVGAVVDDDDDARAIQIGSRIVPIVAGLDDVSRAVWKLSVESVIVAGDPRHGTDYLRDLGWSLEGRATELVIASRLANIAGPRIHFRPVEGLPLMHVELPQFDGPKHALKRATDIVFSGVALVALLPLMAVLAILVKAEDGGPVLFRQERVGRDGQRFSMVKFRSMSVDAEARLAELVACSDGNGTLFKMRDDPRVTRMGRLLRRYSLDELPQLLNIFAGQMSLVGPRPPLPSEVDGYADHVHRRLYIKPGLTGMWQVGGRSDLSWEESVRLDLYYVENWSMTVDFVLLWRTLKVVLRPAGAY